MSDYENVAGGTLKFKGGGGISKKYDLTIPQPSSFRQNAFLLSFSFHGSLSNALLPKPMALSTRFPQEDSTTTVTQLTHPISSIFLSPLNRKKKKTDASKVKAALDSELPAAKPVKLIEKTAAELKFEEVQKKRVSAIRTIKFVLWNQRGEEGSRFSLMICVSCCADLLIVPFCLFSSPLSTHSKKKRCTSRR